MIDPSRLALAAGLVAAYAVWVGMLMRRALQARRHGPDGGADSVLVLHASQTGTAQGLARSTAELLRRAGHAADVRSLGEVTLGGLTAHRRALFVVATCGEGDPPDEALPFMRDVMDAAPPPANGGTLGGLQVGLLALGDRRFDQFCGFARRLDDWLRAHGTQPLFERIEVDAMASDDLARWQQALAPLTGEADPGAWPETETPSAPWRLAARRVLNPGSVGAPVIHVELEPVDADAARVWEAGDLARIVVPGDDARPRDYSIASVPADGRLQLLVRVVQRDDGTRGVASGWLADAPSGSELMLRLVAHPTFRLGDNAGRPLVLIGNGTGIAGLRGHLRARATNGPARHWLVFGERQEAHDFHFRDEIAAWQGNGLLERVDLAFSRDGAERVYVQNRLGAAGEALRAWIADGAAIYVCGSRDGMAGGVDAALRRVLGDEAVDALTRAGRYRRDVY